MNRPAALRATTGPVAFVPAADDDSGPVGAAGRRLRRARRASDRVAHGPDVSPHGSAEHTKSRRRLRVPASVAYRSGCRNRHIPLPQTAILSTDADAW